MGSGKRLSSEWCWVCVRRGDVTICRFVSLLSTATPPCVPSHCSCIGISTRAATLYAVDLLRVWCLHVQMMVLTAWRCRALRAWIAGTPALTLLQVAASALCCSEVECRARMTGQHAADLRIRYAGVSLEALRCFFIAGTTEAELRAVARAVALASARELKSSALRVSDTNALGTRECSVAIVHGPCCRECDDVCAA
jgi:hypothetical protein